MPPKLPRVSAEDAIRALEHLGLYEFVNVVAMLSCGRKRQQEIWVVLYHYIVSWLLEHYEVFCGKQAFL